MTALGDTPAVCLAGASRTGKTALVLALQAEVPEAAYRTFSDPATLAEASRDPGEFLRGLPALAFLDDVDRLPEVLPWLKSALALGQRFLLTTSRHLSGLAEGLSGGLETFTLWPLAQAEFLGTFPGLIDACFQGDPTRLQLEPVTRQDLLGRILKGGYPEVTDLAPPQRDRWFHGYLEALVQGRLRVLTDLREVHHLVKLLTFSGADPLQARRCRELLADAHVKVRLASGPRDVSYGFNDTALQAHVLGMGAAALETQPALAAPLLETFAVMELVKTAPWSGARPALSRFRTGAQELIILEDRRHQLVAFTASATATVQAEAFQGLQALRDRFGERMRAGVVLHAGGEARAMGAGFWTLPFQALWAAKEAGTARI